MLRLCLIFKVVSTKTISFSEMLVTRNLPLNTSPRCTFKIERCDGGMKMTCTCTDQMARQMMQNLCQALQGGMCSCSVMMNGMMICTCNLMMGMCMTEMTADGIKMTCTSGDAKCAKMIQACCDSLTAMLQAGCTCCLMMNNIPVCSS
jgi:hypothetical protein